MGWGQLHTPIDGVGASKRQLCRPRTRVPGVRARGRRLRLDQQRPDQQAARGAGPAGRPRRQPRVRKPFRRHGDRAGVLRRRHARRGVLPRRAHRARRHQHPHPRRAGVADRPRRHHFRRVRRLGAGRLLRPEEARRARRLPRAVPAAQRRGIALDRRQHHQPVARLLRRHQRLDAIPALARRQPVQRRDLRRHERGRSGRASRSTPPTSTTARRSCSAAARSARCARTSRNIRCRSRSRLRRRCRCSSRRW